jgi:ATP-dependent Lhr-like helicase
MDLPGLIDLLTQLAHGAVTAVARDVTEPSPLAHEVLNARPYAFLDDAPLEERRTQAVQMRRSISWEQASDLSALDPRAIAQVLEETTPNPRDADELHDALLVFGYLITDPAWRSLFDELQRAGRAYTVQLGKSEIWIAHERIAWFYAAIPQARAQLPVTPASAGPDAESGLGQIVQSHLELTGPTTASEIAGELGLAPREVQAALSHVESSGFALRGRFRPDAREDEYCERRILARIHRLTLNQLRREIEPVAPAQFIDFLTYYHCLQPDTKKRGVSGLYAVIQQLSGFWAAAQPWEQEILSARVSDFHLGLLDELTRAGRVSWRAASGEASQHFRFSSSTSVTFTSRETRRLYGGAHSQADVESRLGADAKTVLALLASQGALFLDDIKLETRLLPTQLEGALSELLASGRVTCDSFVAARAYGAKHHRAPRRALGRGKSPRAPRDAGRYFLVPALPGIEAEDDQLSTAYAFGLLHRWGVVCKRLLDREQLLLPWATLRRVLSRLEARGEIRGGRFIEHVSGEQFATKEAIVQLRQRRRAGPSSTPIVVSSYDPLNLVGFLDNEPRIAKAKSTDLLIVAGEFIASTGSGRPVRLSSVPRERAPSDETIARAFAPDRHLALNRPPLAPERVQ